MIQAAVSLLHHSRGNVKARDYEFELCRNKLKFYPILYHGVNIESFLDQMESYFNSARKEERVSPKIDFENSMG